MSGTNSFLRKGFFIFAGISTLLRKSRALTWLFQKACSEDVISKLHAILLSQSTRIFARYPLSAALMAYFLLIMGMGSWMKNDSSIFLFSSSASSALFSNCGDFLEDPI